MSAGPPGEGGRRGSRGGRGGFDPVAIFNNFDANKDGLLTPEEMPPERRDRWVAADANKDGKLDRAELSSSMGRRGGGRSGGGANGGGPNVPAGALNSSGGGG